MGGTEQNFSKREPSKYNASPFLNRSHLILNRKFPNGKL